MPRGSASTRSTQGASPAQGSDFVGRKAKHVVQHGFGVGAERRRAAGGLAEASAPRQAGENAAIVGIPKAALTQMIVFDEVERGGERGRGNAGAQQFIGRSLRPAPPQPSGEPVVDLGPPLHPVAEAEACYRREVRNDFGQPLPFLVGADDDADPLVFAYTAVNAM